MPLIFLEASIFKHKLTLLDCFLALILVGCGPLNSVNSSLNTADLDLTKVTGGRSVNGQLAPLNAIVEVSVNGENFCTGVLISPRQVLTAGHCFAKSRNPSKVMVVFSQVYHGFIFTRNTVSIAVDSILIPDEFSPQKPNLQAEFDLAIVGLERSLDASIKPISFSEKGIAVGDSFDFYGFGELSSMDQGTPSSVLQQAKFKIVNNEKGLFQTAAHQAQSACPGDSGGPLLRVIENELQIVGIAHSILVQGDTSPQDHNFCEGAVTEFIDINPRLFWIKSHIH